MVSQIKTLRACMGSVAPDGTFEKICDALDDLVNSYLDGTVLPKACNFEVGEPVVVTLPDGSMRVLRTLKYELGN